MWHNCLCTQILLTYAMKSHLQEVAYCLIRCVGDYLSFLCRYKFKARELDHKILEGGPILPKKPPVKELTQPIGFELEIEKRIQDRENKKQQQEEHFKFHSRPCPTKILEDVVVSLVIPKN